MFKDKNAHHIYPFLGKKRNRNNFFVSANTETETETERGFTFSAKPIFGQNGRNSAENQNRICFSRTLTIIKFNKNKKVKKPTFWSVSLKHFDERNPLIYEEWYLNVMHQYLKMTEMIIWLRKLQTSEYLPVGVYR